MAKKLVDVSGESSSSSDASSGDAGGGQVTPTSAPQRPLLLPLHTQMSIPLPLLRSTPTREETQEEGRVLLSTFVDYQVAQEQVPVAMDPRAAGESIGDMVYSHTIDREDIGTPHSRTEAEALHPVYRNMGRELRALADRFSQSRERIRVRQEADSLDLSSLTRDNLTALMMELFEDGFSRERLVTFFFFCSDLILKAVRCSVGGLQFQVVAWVWAFLRDRVCFWVLQHGGWEAVLTNYLPKLAITAAGVAVCVFTVFYIWKNW